MNSYLHGESLVNSLSALNAKRSNILICMIEILQSNVNSIDTHLNMSQQKLGFYTSLGNTCYHKHWWLEYQSWRWLKSSLETKHNHNSMKAIEICHLEVVVCFCHCHLCILDCYHWLGESGIRVGEAHEQKG